MNKMTMLVMFLSLAFVGKTEARGTGTFTTTTPKPGLFVFDKIQISHYYQFKMNSKSRDSISGTDKRDSRWILKGFSRDS